MPPRLPQNAAGRLGILRSVSGRSYCSYCSTCSLVALVNCRPRERKRWLTRFHSSPRTRRQSNLAVGTGIDREQRVSGPHDQAAELKASLIELQTKFQSYVNLSRLQLALRGLDQPRGNETIRIAIIGGQASSKVKELARLLLADPLKEEEEWERMLTAEQDADMPLLLKIGEDNHDAPTHEVGNRLVREISLSSPTLNAHRLEILLLETDILSQPAATQEDLDDTILVPTVEIPTSNTGRFTPIRTPVHKALIVGDGILGAASLVNLPIRADRNVITSAVHLLGFVQEGKQELPFAVIDVSLARAALVSFRESLSNAMSYEHDWFNSGVPEILEWLKAGTFDTQGVSMKAPIHALILSILADADRCIQYEESRRQYALQSSPVSSTALQSLREGLQSWAQLAHTELRDQLDVAFEGKRWRKLSWWKLFWRVDDVSMMASDILNQRFLTEAEKEVIYLAGRIWEAGVFNKLPAEQLSHWAYKPEPEPLTPTTLGSSPPPLRYEDLLERQQDDEVVPITLHPWPLHIPTTRSYLSLDTVPALQALAQKLVLQTLTTSSFASAFAGLIYVSTISTGFYEAGAVAALGIVWSLKRMQRKWETARKFWEGEVREEGRRAIRMVEGVVNDVLAEPAKGTIEGAEDLKQARKAVERASHALEIAASSVK